MRSVVSALVLWIVAIAAQAQGAAQWVEGKQYSVIRPAQPVSVPAGTVEVTEVFSYGCPGCAQFQPTANKLKASLPSNAKFVCVAASWNEGESWPMFQRAYYTAQALGVADRAHDAMFDAIWKSGELAVVDFKTNRLKKPQPTIEQAARFYARVAGVKADEFVATAKSFSVDLAMKRADGQVKGYVPDSTPTIIVAGKYRLTPTTAGGYEQLIELVKWLVAKETRK